MNSLAPEYSAFRKCRAKDSLMEGCQMEIIVIIMIRSYYRLVNFFAFLFSSSHPVPSFLLFPFLLILHIFPSSLQVFPLMLFPSPNFHVLFYVLLPFPHLFTVSHFFFPFLFSFIFPFPSPLGDLLESYIEIVANSQSVYIEIWPSVQIHRRHEI